MRFLSYLATCSLAPVFGQDLLYSVPASEVIHPAEVVGLGDVDLDGVTDLAIGTRTISGPDRVQVHSGADGALLYVVGAPPGKAFYGHMVLALDDLDGDGRAEFAVVAAKSGDQQSPDGFFDVISGADGSLHSRFFAPPGVIFNEFPRAQAIEDVDGDGHRDILVGTFSALPNWPEIQAFSSASGAPLYSSDVDGAGPFTSLHEDYDGDGIVDFAVGLFDFGGAGPRTEIRSGADGSVLAALPDPSQEIGFDNSPIISVPDLDGDGRRDLAAMLAFSAMVRVYSSQSGARLLDLSDTGGAFSFGYSLQDAGDVDFDGAPDLLLGYTAADAVSRVGAFSLVDGGEVFATAAPVPGLGFGFRTALLAGADAEGFFAFAALNATGYAFADTYVERFAPRVGTSFCVANANSSGLPAAIEALGTTSIGADKLLLAADQLPANQFGLFFYGPSQQQPAPFGNGLMCIAPGATGYGRLAAEKANASGRIVHRLDYQNPPSQATRILAGSTWHFQTWYRDPQAGGAKFNTSDALTLGFSD